MSNQTIALPPLLERQMKDARQTVEKLEAGESIGGYARNNPLYAHYAGGLLREQMKGLLAAIEGLREPPPVATDPEMGASAAVPLEPERRVVAYLVSGPHFFAALLEGGWARLGRVGCTYYDFPPHNAMTPKVLALRSDFEADGLLHDYQHWGSRRKAA